MVLRRDQSVGKRIKATVTVPHPFFNLILFIYNVLSTNADFFSIIFTDLDHSTKEAKCL